MPKRLSLREQRRLAILRGDRHMITFLAPLIMGFANTVAVVWILIFLYALSQPGAGEAVVILLMLAVPVFAFRGINRECLRLLKVLRGTSGIVGFLGK